MTKPVIQGRTTRKKGSQTEQAVEEIKDYIRVHQLGPGDALPTEATLVDALGFSRSTIREAIRILGTLDIVEVRHGYGTRIGQMSLQPMLDGLVFRTISEATQSHERLLHVVDTREALDMSLGAELCAAGDTEALAPLRELVDDMYEVSQRGESFLSEDREFHRMLVGLTSNPLISELIGALWHVHMQVIPELNLSVATADDIEDTVAAHADILDAIADGDEDAYRDAVRRHYLPLRRMLVKTEQADQTENDA